MIQQQCMVLLVNMLLSMIVLVRLLRLVIRQIRVGWTIREFNGEIKMTNKLFEHTVLYE